MSYKFVTMYKYAHMAAVQCEKENARLLSFRTKDDMDIVQKYARTNFILCKF